MLSPGGGEVLAQSWLNTCGRPGRAAAGVTRGALSWAGPWARCPTRSQPRPVGWRPPWGGDPDRLRRAHHAMWLGEQLHLLAAHGRPFQGSLAGVTPERGEGLVEETGQPQHLQLISPPPFPSTKCSTHLGRGCCRK